MSGDLTREQVTACFFCFLFIYFFFLLFSWAWNLATGSVGPAMDGDDDDGVHSPW
jgi:hypothetical protein